jgi:hypothetical protein
VTVTDGNITSITLSSGNGGLVNVNATDTVSLSSQSGNLSGISGLAFSGSTGNAGSVVIHANNVTVTDGALIRSDTLGSGDGDP